MPMWVAVIILLFSYSCIILATLIGFGIIEFEWLQDQENKIAKK